MTIECVAADGTVTMKLKGELDHHAAMQTLKQVSEQIDSRRPVALCMDMGGVSFMDSSGIAVLLGSFKRMKEIGGSFRAVKVSDQAKRVLTTAGIDRIITLS